MSLSSLPSVLAQSIAHFLSTKERLRLARCSRQSRILAEAPFAWLGADSVTLNIDHNDLPSGPLLRSIPTRLVWDRSVKPDSIAGTVSNVFAIADRTHLVAFLLYQRLDDAIATDLFQAPSLMRLQTLNLRSHPRRHIELACTLPLLTALTLHTPLAEDETSLLSPATSLTDLTVWEPFSGPSCLPSVLHHTKLRRLEVHRFRWAGLSSFSQNPGWQQLRELSLVFFSRSVPSLSAETIAAAFSCLRSLLVLRLDGAGLQRVLTHVHRIPTLHRLIIECGSWGKNLHCSDAALLSLLRTSPDLCVEWLVPQPQSQWYGSRLLSLVVLAGCRLMRVDESNGNKSRVCIVRGA